MSVSHSAPNLLWVPPRKHHHKGYLWILFRAQPNRRQVAREQTICLTEGLWQNQPELRGGGRGKERHPEVFLEELGVQRMFLMLQNT